MKRSVRAAIAIAVATVGCNLVLGIEEHDLRAADAGIEAEAPIPEAAPPTDRCTSDADCRAPNGCYKARCDTTLGVCRFALCEGGRACSAGVCNPATLKCEDERDYGFRAASYPLGTTLGSCSKNPSACVGGAYPFLFIGTRDEVVALRIDDLRTTDVRRVPINDLRVRPGRIVASAHRVWIVGDVQGSEPPYTLAIASIDVPADPTTRELAAKSGTLKYPFPSVEAYPAPNGGLFIAYDDAANPQNLPAALISEPLTTDGVVGVAAGQPADGGTKVPDPPSPPTLVMYRTASLVAGSNLVASSGGRLLAYRFPITFNVITGPGTAEATAQADTVLAPPYAGLVVPRFTQGPDGVVLMGGPIVADPPGDCNCSSRQRMHWILPNALATTVDTSKFLDPEVYSNPFADPAICRSCPLGYFAQPSLAVWLDSRSALVAAPQSDPAANRVLTAVRLLERDPLAASPKRRVAMPATELPTGNFASDRIALAASNGFGFLVIADPEGNSARLSIFDPRCDNN